MPLNNVNFPEFWPPSSILAEMENVVYLENVRDEARTLCTRDLRCSVSGKG